MNCYTPTNNKSRVCLACRSAYPHESTVTRNIYNSQPSRNDVHASSSKTRHSSFSRTQIKQEYFVSYKIKVVRAGLV